MCEQKKCIKCNIKFPSFNYKNETKRLYCNTCKLPDMINVKSKKCITCKIKMASFNYAHKNKTLYCFTCKLPNMVNVRYSKYRIKKQINKRVKPNWHKIETLI
jgi:hypothetical protein